MKKLQIVGMLIGLTGIALAWVFFSWKLVLVLTLAMWGNNVEQNCRK